MNSIRVMTISSLILAATCAVAAETPALSNLKPADSGFALQAGSILPKPTVGIRIGVGEWGQSIVSAGVDVTLKVPVLPLPSLRIDGEVWAQPSHTSDRHGNSLSLLEMQTFVVGYVGVGPSFYYSDDYGAHHSGFAAKILGGVNLPGSAFAEASVILGASPSPLMISIGKRF